MTLNEPRRYLVGKVGFEPTCGVRDLQSRSFSLLDTAPLFFIAYL